MLVGIADNEKEGFVADTVGTEEGVFVATTEGTIVVFAVGVPLGLGLEQEVEPIDA